VRSCSYAWPRNRNDNIPLEDSRGKLPIYGRHNMGFRPDIPMLHVCELDLGTNMPKEHSSVTVRNVRLVSYGNTVNCVTEPMNPGLCAFGHHVRCSNFRSDAVERQTYQGSSVRINSRIPFACKGPGAVRAHHGGPPGSGILTRRYGERAFRDPARTTSTGDCIRKQSDCGEFDNHMRRLVSLIFEGGCI
jgi:hypothetical protein